MSGQPEVPGGHTSSANRLVVVDETGRVYDREGVHMVLAAQDDGQTLKVFVGPMTKAETAHVAKVHREALADDIQKDSEAFPQLVNDPGTGHG